MRQTNLKSQRSGWVFIFLYASSKRCQRHVMHSVSSRKTQTEHIDNPKGYGEGEDPRKYHPKLRPPVDPIELEVDLRTGIKNYIANEQGHWDTSKALVRRTLEKCIHLGRQHRGSGRKEDLYESFRLLGQSVRLSLLYLYS
jgi:hypothetical protein